MLFTRLPSTTTFPVVIDSSPATMRSDISELQKRLGTTTLYVTHDQIEAMTMGDRVAVLKSGELQQVGTPREIYDRPANLFVAGFVGSPPMNLVRGRIELDAGGAMTVRFGGIVVPLTPEVIAARGLEARAGTAVSVGVRPEDLGQAGPGAPAPGEARHRAAATRVEAVGASLLVYFNVDGDTGEPADEAGAEERLVADAAQSLCATFPPRSLVRPGDDIEVAVAATRLHLFDPDTEQSITA